MVAEAEEIGGRRRDGSRASELVRVLVVEEEDGGGPPGRLGWSWGGRRPRASRVGAGAAARGSCSGGGHGGAGATGVESGGGRGGGVVGQVSARVDWRGRGTKGIWRGRGRN